MRWQFVSWVCGGFLRGGRQRVVGLAWIRERRLIFVVVDVIGAWIGEWRLV